MKIDLTIKSEPGDSLMNVIDMAESLMLQYDNIAVAHFKFNGIPLYFKRSGDPAKVEKYYLQQLPKIAKRIQVNADDSEYMSEIIGTLNALSNKRIVLYECVRSFSPSQELLPVTDPLTQCEPYKAPFDGCEFEVIIKGCVFDRD